MKVLFLDVDGVLNGHDWDDEAQSCNIRRECVKRLNRVVNATKCRIVLSSAWRYMIHKDAMTLRGFGYMLRTHGLLAHCGSADVFVGLTDLDAMDHDPHAPVDFAERARQCRKWLSEHLGEIEAFAAIDDEDHRFASEGIPSVRTNGGIGMTEADADQLIRLLS